MMNKQIKKVALTAAALVMGLTITACTQNGTMEQKANRTGQDVRQLARDVNPMSTDGRNYTTHSDRYYTPNSYNARSNNGMNNDGMNNGSMNNGSMNNGSMNNGTANNANGSRMKQITDLAEKVQGVNKAVVLVNNNDCVVALDTNNKNTAGIEKNVRNQLKKKFPSYDFHITSDKKLSERVNSLNTRFTNGNGYNSNGLNNGNVNNNNNGQYNGYNNGYNDSPVRNFADDVGDLIRDIGNAVTAPLR